MILGLTAYLVLLAASHLVQAVRTPRDDPGADLPAVEIPLTDSFGPVVGRDQRVTYRRWASETPVEQGTPPVILLHGSPGDSSNFWRLGPILARAGHDTIAPDLPGFGGSTKQIPSYSLTAHAHALLLYMDELGIERAHVVGWSQGGGVGLVLADLAPDRVATLTLMASVGVQRAEGSGSYHFEHLKYSVGYVGLVLGGELIPHFGVLRDHNFRRSFMRNFWDSDQRPLRRIMRELDTPTLILHGKDDPLTPEWGARLHHQLITPSKLVVFDASHFLPIVEPRVEDVARRMDHFYQQHQTPGGPFIRETIDLAERGTSLGARTDRAVLWAQQYVPWWVVLLAIAVFAYRRAELAAAVVGVAVAMVWVDAGVMFAGLLLGVCVRTGWMMRVGRASRPPTPRPRREDRFRHLLVTRFQPWIRDEAARAAGATGEPLLRPVLGAIIGCGVWTGVAFLSALVAASLALARFEDSLPALFGAVVVATLAVRAAVFACTWTGRQRLKATLRRARKHEFWPAWAYYAPLVPWLLWQGCRNGGLMSFTCANPAIGVGGGVVGESKQEILDAMTPLGDAVLASVLLDQGHPGGRIGALGSAMASGRLPAGFPVVLKPDAGQRGYAVHIARDDADASAYLARIDRPVIAQAYHPGPIEVGVMWVRDPHAPADRVGRVFSLTVKHFSDIVGDGRHTLEQLTYRHRRFRCQADMLLARLAGQLAEVPAVGEKVRLVTLGNHSQGAIFRDAVEHITPALEAWVDRAAAAFNAPNSEAGSRAESDNEPDNGLDFGRFDIRARSIDDLRNAHDLAIIELNGTSAESLNIYDPDKSLLWSWRVLLEQWAVLYQLGGRRRRMGVRPLGPWELRRAWQEFDQGRPAMDADR